MSNTNTYVGSKIKGLRETKNLSIEASRTTRTCPR